MSRDLADLRPVLRVAPDANPALVMSAAKRAAIQHYWLLQSWTQFSEAARAQLDAEASAEGYAAFREIVAQWFRIESPDGGNGHGDSSGKAGAPTITNRADRPREVPVQPSIEGEKP